MGGGLSAQSYTAVEIDNRFPPDFKRTPEYLRRVVQLTLTWAHPPDQPVRVGGALLARMSLHTLELKDATLEGDILFARMPGLERLTIVNCRGVPDAALRGAPDLFELEVDMRLLLGYSTGVEAGAEAGTGAEARQSRSRTVVGRLTVHDDRTVDGLPADDFAAVRALGYMPMAERALATLLARSSIPSAVITRVLFGFLDEYAIEMLIELQLKWCVRRLKPSPGRLHWPETSLITTADCPRGVSIVACYNRVRLGGAPFIYGLPPTASADLRGRAHRYDTRNLRTAIAVDSLPAEEQKQIEQALLDPYSGDSAARRDRLPAQPAVHGRTAHADCPVPADPPDGAAVPDVGLESAGRSDNDDVS